MPATTTRTATATTARRKRTKLLVQASNKSLPDCDGPSLNPFKDENAEVNFIRLLSSNDESRSGGHAHVFEVLIKSQNYALKIFKFYDSSEDEKMMLPEEKEEFPSSVVQAHMDPFYNECRAYGRLIEKGVNGELAVRCYGYMELPADVEIELHNRFDVASGSWRRPPADIAKPIAKRQPLRCIVKDLVADEASFTVENLKVMLAQLRRMRYMRVFPMDIAARNYRGGVLIDFSAAVTEPHYLFQTRARWWVATEMWQDLYDFDDMVKESGFKTNIKAAPDTEVLQKMRRPPPVDRIFKILRR